MITHNSLCSGLERMNKKWAALVSIHYSLSTVLFHVNNLCSDTAKPFILTLTLYFTLFSFNSRTQLHLISTWWAAKCGRACKLQNQANKTLKEPSVFDVIKKKIPQYHFNIDRRHCSCFSCHFMRCKRNIIACVDMWRILTYEKSIWRYMQRLITQVMRPAETLIHLQPGFIAYSAADMRGDNHAFYMHRHHVRQPAVLESIRSHFTCLHASIYV